MSKELIGIIAVGIALAGLNQAQYSALRAEIIEIRRDVQTFSERVIRNETKIESIEADVESLKSQP